MIHYLTCLDMLLVISQSRDAAEGSKATGKARCRG
jgi:hypothetical protein